MRLSFLGALVFSGRCSDQKRGISPLPGAQEHYLGPCAGCFSGQKQGGGLGPEIAWRSTRNKAAGTIFGTTTPLRETRSEKHRWLTGGRAFTEANLCFDQIRHGPLSDGRSLRQCGGRLFVPVFPSGTGGPNTARRRRTRPRGFSRGHRKDPQARTRGTKGRALAPHSAAQESLASSGLSPFGMGTGRRKDPSRGIGKRMAGKEESGTRTLELPFGLAAAHNLEARRKARAGRKNLQARPGTIPPHVVRER